MQPTCPKLDRRAGRARVTLAGLPQVAVAEHDVTRAELVLFAAAVFAFALRDLAVIAFFRFGPRPKRGDFGAVLALLLLYALGVMITSNLGEALALAVPHPQAPLISLVSGLIQAAGIGVLALRRIRGSEASTAA